MTKRARTNGVYSPICLSLSVFQDQLTIRENDPSRTGKQLFDDDEKRTEVGIRRMVEERADGVKKEVTTWLTWLVLTWKPTSVYLPGHSFVPWPGACTHSQTSARASYENCTPPSYCRAMRKKMFRECTRHEPPWAVFTTNRPRLSSQTGDNRGSLWVLWDYTRARLPLTFAHDGNALWSRERTLRSPFEIIREQVRSRFYCTTIATRHGLIPEVFVGYGDHRSTYVSLTKRFLTSPLDALTLLDVSRNSSLFFFFIFQHTHRRWFRTVTRKVEIFVSLSMVWRNVPSKRRSLVTTLAFNVSGEFFGNLVR